MARRRWFCRHSPCAAACPAVHVRDGDRTQAVTRAARWIITIVASGCLGCAAAALSQLAPVAGQFGMAAGVTVAQSVSGDEEVKGDNAERCEDLAKATPGVEELRRNKDGEVQSRQWRLTEQDGNPIWLYVRTPESPDNGWEPRGALTKLSFNPPLTDMLVPDEPQFMAYVPSIAENSSESGQMAAMTGSFGAENGVFYWKGRAYSFALTKKLPCYKPEKEPH